MRKNMMAILLLLLSSAARRMNFSKGRQYADVMHLKANLLYLKIIKTARLLSLSHLGVGVCLVFLLSSLVLFPLTFFFYAPFTMEVKMWTGFGIALVYLAVSFKTFSCIFSEDKWLSIFNAQHLVNIEEEIASKEEENLQANTAL